MSTTVDVRYLRGAFLETLSGRVSVIREPDGFPTDVVVETDGGAFFIDPLLVVTPCVYCEEPITEESLGWPSCGCRAGRHGAEYEGRSLF